YCGARRATDGSPPTAEAKPRQPKATRATTWTRRNRSEAEIASRRLPAGRAKRGNTKPRTSSGCRPRHAGPTCRPTPSRLPWQDGGRRQGLRRARQPAPQGRAAQGLRASWLRKISPTEEAELMSKKKSTPGGRAKKKAEVSLIRSSAAEYLTFVAASGQ